jgi:glycosyltransferase involved in cell wall biosynthesis
MVTHDRPDLLRQAVNSIERQDYPNYEVVLVDDGSTQPDALALLDELEERFAPRGWQVVRQENRYLGAARNAAARQAQGEYLLFMDDDNCAKEHELSAFVAIAEHAGADILTACRENFTGEASPLEGEVASWVSVFLGAAVGAGLFHNVYGDANALIRRNAFIELDGFTEEYGLGCEDWEFFAKAVLAGYDLQVVPEPLFWYRLSDESMIETTPPPRNLLRAARPYADAVPDELRGVVLLAQGTVLGGERYGRRYGLESASGPHIVLAGIKRCLQEGPRALIGHVLRKLRELWGRG